MLQFTLGLTLLFSAFATPLFTHAETPIRSGLGFPSGASPQFTDQNILNAIRYAVENSDVAPIVRIKLDGTSEKMSVIVVGNREAEQFSFKVQGDKTIFEKGPLTETILHQVDIPFGSLQAHGFQQNEGLSYSAAAGWIAVGVVGVYAAKKILNKMTIGKFSAADDHEHDSLFPAPREMREEMAANRAIMQKAVELAERALDGQMHDLVKPLALAAACGADHGHDHAGHDHAHGFGAHKHTPTSFNCEAIDQSQAEAARKTLLNAFPRYASAFGKDFYKELISPVVGLVQAVKNKETRKQIWNFFDLISRRMIKERGVGAAVATGVFVGTGQVIIELLESFVMPAGAHMFCQVGNAAVLAVAAKTYTTYFCMTQHQEFKDKTWADRWRVAQQISRLSKVNAAVVNDTEKSIHALNLLFRLVERDVRHARNLEDLRTAESRELARRLGILRRELTVLSIRLINGNAQEEEARLWLKDLYDVQSVLHDPGACADLLSPAA